MDLHKLINSLIDKWNVLSMGDRTNVRRALSDAYNEGYSDCHDNFKRYHDQELAKARHAKNEALKWYEDACKEIEMLHKKIKEMNDG